MKLKKKEFLSLIHVGMFISEYWDRFTQLSRYAPEEVDTDEKRQEQFLEGLIGPLNYHYKAKVSRTFRLCLTRQLAWKGKEWNYQITRGNFRDSIQKHSST
jgi:hypothetical protein